MRTQGNDKKRLNSDFIVGTLSIALVRWSTSQLGNSAGLVEFLWTTWLSR